MKTNSLKIISRPNDVHSLVLYYTKKYNENFQATKTRGAQVFFVYCILFIYSPVAKEAFLMILQKFN